MLGATARFRSIVSAIFLAACSGCGSSSDFDAGDFDAGELDAGDFDTGDRDAAATCSDATLQALDGDAAEEPGCVTEHYLASAADCSIEVPFSVRRCAGTLAPNGCTLRGASTFYCGEIFDAGPARFILGLNEQLLFPSAPSLAGGPVLYRRLDRSLEVSMTYAPIL